jgi:hypothetical protein
MRWTFESKSFVLGGPWLSQSSKYIHQNILINRPNVNIGIVSHAFEDEQIYAGRENGQAKKDEKEDEENIDWLIAKSTHCLGRDKVAETNCGNLKKEGFI